MIRLSRYPAIFARHTPCIHTMSSHTYSSAVHDLNNLQTNYQLIQKLKESGGRLNKYSIPEFAAFIEKIGHSVSDLDKLNIIHVTGTKGKGSTCAFTASILGSLTAPRKPKIGLFTSPHLIEVRERIQIDGSPISHSKFTQYFYEVYDALRAPHPKLRKVSDSSPEMPMYFRFLTLMAFHAFLRERVDVAIIEVGVGGEFDSTNVIESPVVCGIAALGIDHQGTLGSTIEEIAWHKAGILKPNAPAFTVAQPESAMRVIERRAQERGTAVDVVAETDSPLGIPGAHQRANAALAVSLAKTWARARGYSLCEEQIARALAHTAWPGRSQTFRARGVEWCVDGAHTRESIGACARWFAAVQGADPRECVLLFNAAHERSSKELIESLCAGLGERVVKGFAGSVFCPNLSLKRSDSCNFTVAGDKKLTQQHDAAEMWREVSGCGRAQVVASIDDAVSFIEREYAGARVLVTGSLHLVGGVLDAAKGGL